MMKRIIPLILAFVLAGCVTTSVNNPVNNTNLYQAELVFDGSVKTFNDLKSLCVQRVLKPSCRTYVVQGQSIIRKAYAADKAARNFVTNNPTLDATNAVGAFTGLVSDFNTTVNSLNATK